MKLLKTLFEMSLVRENLSSFANIIKEKYGLEKFSLYSHSDGTVELAEFQVPKGERKSGIGSAVMRDLLAYTDKNGLTVWLSVAQRDPRTGTTSRSRLVKFYKQFGFVENKGRNKRFDLSLYANMYRDPQG